MRFVFDTSVLIDYLRDDDTAVNALFLAAERGEVFISLISLMELYSPHTSDQEIEVQIKAVQDLCERVHIRAIPVSKASQRRALAILKAHRSRLGRNGVPDSLILGTGSARRAYVVTRDAHWFQIGGHVLSPEKLLQRF